MPVPSAPTPRHRLPGGWLHAATLALALGLLSLPACKQKSGESCQTTSDCDKGLVCCFDGINASGSLGVCTPGDSCTPIADAGVDAAPPADAGMDAAPPADASPDAAPPEDASPDAALDDAGQSLDASMTQDASQ